MISYKKFALLALPILILGAGGYIVYARDNKPKVEVPAQTQPAQAENQSEGKDKEDLLQRQEAIENQPPSETTGKKTIKPTITYAGQFGSAIEIGAYVPGVFEDGGTCTLTMEKNGQKAVVSVQAVKNVSAVDCPVMAISRSSVGAGIWQAVVNYDSPSAQGASDKREVEVK